MGSHILPFLVFSTSEPFFDFIIRSWSSSVTYRSSPPRFNQFTFDPITGSLRVKALCHILRWHPPRIIVMILCAPSAVKAFLVIRYIWTTKTGTFAIISLFDESDDPIKSPIIQLFFPPFNCIRSPLSVRIIPRRE